MAAAGEVNPFAFRGRRNRCLKPVPPPDYLDGWGNRCGIWDFKQRVRYRDGYRCTRCGVTADELGEERPTRRNRLHVHRLTPNAPYTWEGVVTVCASCHRRYHLALDAGEIKPGERLPVASRKGRPPKGRG